MAQLLFVTSVLWGAFLQPFLVQTSQLQVYDESAELKTCIDSAIRATFKDDQPLYIFFDKYGRDLMPEDFERTHVIADLTKPTTFDLRNGYNYLVYANDVSSLSSFFRKLPLKGGILGFGKTYAYGTVLLVTSYEDVGKIYKDFWERGIINVVIFMVHQKQVYISSPHYRSNKCGAVFKEYLVHNCTCNFEVNFKLFKQFDGCQIQYKKVAAFDSFPNQIADVAILYLSERFGVKVVPFNLISNAITVLHSTRMNIYKDFEESYTLFSDDFAWVAPISEHSTFTLIDRIFELKVWISIAFAFLTSVTAWWCITIFTKTQRTFQLFCKVCLDLFSLTTCGVLNRVPRFRALKVIVLSYLLYSMLIQTGFKANLIKCLTVGTKHRIDTLEKVAASSLPVCIPSELYKISFSKKRDEEELYSAIKKKFIKCELPSCNDIREPCIYLTLKSHLNFLTVNLTEMTIIYNNTLAKRPQWMFFVPKGHYTLGPLNRAIESVIESGTYQKMYDEFYSKFPTDREDEDSEPVALNLDHVRGIFVIYVLGCVLSFIVFGVEVFIHRML